MEMRNNNNNSTGEEKNRKKKIKKKKKINIWRIFLIVFLSLGIISILGMILGFSYIANTAPELDKNRLANPVPSILYDKDGNEFAKLGVEWRVPIEYQDLPEVLVDAVVATEDSRFFQHNGFDLPRFAKATAQSLIYRDLGAAGGGSTITMQLSKLAFTSKDQTLKRKFTDIYMSIFKIEKNYTKEDILTLYLNRVQFGPPKAAGIEAASKYYFGKSVKDVTLPEAALLAGMLQAPTSYNPTVNPNNANARKNKVLDLMLMHGYISEEEKTIAEKVQIKDLLAKSILKDNKYQAYIDTVVVEVKKKTGIDPATYPLNIYTNMDPNFQDFAHRLENGEIVDFPDDQMQLGFVVTETDTGKIRAIGAGRNREGQLNLNRATDLKRQPGSTIKPVVDYGPGFEYGNWDTYHPFVDEPYQYKDGPELGNFDGKYLGFVTLREALVNSRNIPALKAFRQTKNKDKLEFFKKLGLKPETNSNDKEYIHEAYAIGGFTGTNPVEMAGAYAAFGNGGYYIEPYSVTKIVDQASLEETDLTPEKTRAMKETTAYLVTSVLESSLTHPWGFGHALKIPGENIAFKSGTTNLDEETRKKYNIPKGTPRDSWGVAYSPNYTTAIWIGYDKLSSEYYLKSTISSLRTKVVGEILKNVSPKNNKDFKKPNNLIEVAIEKFSYPTPQLPSENTPADLIVKELFIKGTEPTSTDVSTRFQKFDAPTNLKLVESNDGVTLEWTPSKLASEYTKEAIEKRLQDEFWGKDKKIIFDQYTKATGVAGYDILVNGKSVGFTSETKFDITKLINNGAVISVVARYEKFLVNQSDEATIKLEVETPEQPQDQKPSLQLNGDKTMKIALGSTFTDPGATATDQEDGDLTNSIVISIYNESNLPVDQIDTNTLGTYTIIYEVTDSASNKVKVQRKVIIE